MIILAPMEGVVDPSLRRLYSKIGGFDRFVTEFVRVTDMVLPDHVFYKYAPELYNQGRTAEGVPVYVQLLGGNPAMLAENAARLVELGAPGVDLNFGCPAKTVNRHDGGATLLKDPSRLYDVITAVRGRVAGRIPVTAKVRLGFEDKTKCLEIARAVDESGADGLVIHARTKLEGYRPPAHWEFIAFMRRAVKRVPVFANGDLWNLEDFKRCRQVTGCDDIAIGRGAVACPDLAVQIKAYLAGEICSAMSWSRVQRELIPFFVEDSRQAKSAHFALTRVKQWTKFLGLQYPESKELFERIKRGQTLNEVADVLGCQREEVQLG